MSGLPAALGRYRIDGLLGQGAMGVVYRAHDPEIDRPVAIKLIRADLLATEARAEYLQRFRREAQAAGRCSHPNIVALHDVAADAAGNPFLVMEYVAAASLDRLLAAGQAFTAAPAVAIAVQVLDALDCAHRLGVVHRDIKPANILLLPTGMPTGVPTGMPAGYAAAPGWQVPGWQVKVTDFGISRLLASELTQLGAVIGTPSYMSPEQCLGDDAGPQSDLFSVASVLYELLSGRRAFVASSLGRLRTQLTQAALPPLPGLSPALQAVLDRAHAKRPEARFASAAAMAEALRAVAPLPHAAAQAATVVMSAPPTHPAAALPAPGGAALDAAAAAMIETALSRAVGPIARHLLRRALAEARSPQTLLQTLAAGIDAPEPRRDFLRAASAALHGATAAGVAATPATLPGVTPPSAIPPEVRERLTRELGRHVGPIATVLVRRAAASAASVEQLRTALAAHITDAADRQAFLAGR